MVNTGMVYIVGAGPGDPRLITLKGLECIKKAEVLVYDRLVNLSLLSYAPPEAERIFVGKRPDFHPVAQEEINRILAEKALLQKRVVRLKGGDPFVFGRGGEEAEFLAERGIPFEIIPGITSAVAVPAYAGIPVTHRSFVSAFSVITGHEENDKENTAIRWDKLAQAKDTLIFLMGIKNLQHITEKLISEGKSPQTPAALIRWGTLARQQVLRGTLENISSRVKETGFEPPAVAVIGEVVSLRDILNWWEKKPLFGRTVIITRPGHLQASFSNMVLELGGEPVYFPTVEVVPPSDWSLLDDSLKQISEYSWMIFTSVNGVDYFFSRLKAKAVDIRELKGIKMAAIGPKTAEALKGLGLKVDFQPGEYRAEAVAEGLRQFLSPGQKVLLPRADIARPELARALKELRVNVREVTAYRNLLPEEQPDISWEDIISGSKKPIITFTSSSTVRNFFRLLGEERAGEIAQKSVLASIGPVTSETLRSLGFKPDVEASFYTMEGLLQAILKYTIDGE